MCQVRPLREGTRVSHRAEGDGTEAKAFPVFWREGKNDTGLASLRLGSLNNFPGFWAVEPGSLVPDPGVIRWCVLFRSVR